MLDSSHLHHMETEQALLGAFFLKPALVTETASLVAPEDFFEPLHGKIHGTMMRFAGEGRAITIDTVGPFFAHEPPINELTPRQYFGRLAAASASLKAAPDYARIVREFAVRRALHEAGTLAQQLAGDMERTPAQAAAETASELDSIVTGAKLARQTRLDVAEAADKLLDALENGSEQIPVPTGLADLDRAMGGFTQGDYHILAGRPSMGKTALAGAFALNAARRGFGTMFFSLEMRTETVMARIFSDLVYNSTTPIPYRDILRHKADPQRKFLNEHQIWRLKEAREIFERMPLVIDDQSNLSVSEIAARGRRQAVAFEEKGFALQLVVIDHKDFIRSSGRYAGNKVEENREISAALKSMFKELNIAGLLLCQLNRENEKRANKRPDLPDLQGSGAFEQDADLALFAYREAYYLESTRLDDPDAEGERMATLDKCANNLEVIIAKQRNGPRQPVDLWANMANNAIRNKLR